MKMKRIISSSLIAAALLAGPGRTAAWSEEAAEPPAGAPAPADGASGAPAAPATQAQQQPAAPGPATPAGPKASNVKQWLDTHQRTKKATLHGALIGAWAGAWGAAVRGQNVARGALVGAVAGGIAGFLIGKNQDKIYAGRDRAVELAHYEPSQGYVMRVEEITCEPANAKPGESALLSVRYLVIGPDPQEEITVNSFRGIKYQDDYIFGDGPRPFVVPHGGGIVTTQVRVTIPDKAPAGTYAVEAMFEDPRGRFQQSRSSPLYIVS